MGDAPFIGVIRGRILCRGQWPLPVADFWNSSRLWFAPGFLLNPNPGWRVAWNGETANPMGEWWLDAGTVVQHDDPKRIWRLTGMIDESTRYLEGVWPD